jgi:ATP/maltotriose-dependent transcriptional regulator MalT
VWNEAGISLRLRILPPFWQTWWFRVLLGLAVIAFFVQFNRTRARRLAARIKTEVAMDHYCDQYHVSTREKEIIMLVLKGKSNREIEDTLFISMGTVKNRSQLITLFKNLQVK